MNLNFGLAALTAVAFVGSVRAETVYLTQGDEYTDYILYAPGQSGYDSKYDAYWSDKAALHASGNYVFSSKYVLDGETKTVGKALIRNRLTAGMTFVGASMQIGSLDPEGTFLMKQRAVYSQESATSTISDLRLCKGIWTVAGSESAYFGIAGAIKVQSPESAPFEFYSPATLDFRWTFYSSISGAAGTALKFRHDATSTHDVEYVLAGDNSDYAGKFIVDGADVTLLVASDTALGGDSGALVADAVRLANGGGFGIKSGANLTIASANRGITLESTGGAFVVPAGSYLTLQAPVSGAGDAVVRGGGVFAFDGAWSAGRLRVNTGTTLLIGPNATGLDGKVDYEGKAVVALPMDGATNALPSGIDGLYLGFFCDSLTTSGCYELSAEHTIGFWPVGVVISSMPTRPEASRRFPILRIPTSVKTVTADDFFVSGTTVFNHVITVETSGDMQTVYLSFPNVLTAVDINNSISKWKDGATQIDVYAKYAAGGATWDEFAAQYGGYAWHSALGDTRRFNAPYHANPYIGTPFSVKGAGVSGSSRLNYCMKQGNEYHYDDLRLYGNLYFYGNTCNPTVSGKLTLLSSETGPTELNAPNEKGTLGTISAAIHGDGYALIMPMGAQFGGRTLALTGDNSRFLGTFDVASYPGTAIAKEDARTNYTYWAVSSGNGFGGNPYSFTADAVRLRGGTVLKVDTDVKMPYVNRGFTVTEWPSMEVAAGKTLEIASKVTIAGELTKAGEGTLVLDDIAASAGAKLTVRAGQIAFGSEIPPAPW